MVIKSLDLLRIGSNVFMHKLNNLQGYHPEASEKQVKKQQYIVDPIGLEHYITQFSL